MVQSYPVFAFALAALIARLEKNWQKISLYVIGIYLIAVNLFQIVQYNKTILHYNDMNRVYYSKIYLNASPSALDFSLLDDPDYLSDEKNFTQNFIFIKPGTDSVACSSGNSFKLSDAELKINYHWLKVNCSIKGELGQRTTNLRMNLFHDEQLVKTVQVRLFYPTSSETDWNKHEFYIEVPNDSKVNREILLLESFAAFKGEIKELKIFGFSEISK
jgi:hypothetical protein